MTEPGAVSLEQSQGQVVQLLLLTKSDEELLAQLGVEKGLFFFELQFWFSSLGPYRGTEGGDVVTDVVNAGFLNITCVSVTTIVSSKYYLQGYRVIKEVISLIIHDVSRLETSRVWIF